MQFDHLKRREFIALLGGTAAWPLAARAQGERMRRVAVIIAVGESDPQAQARAAAFRQALAELGWIEGRNVEIACRFVGTDLALMRRIAKEVIDSGPEVIVANTTPVAAALQREKSAIPIVFNLASDPIRSGFVESFARPGGTITGFSNIYEPRMGSKWLALIKEIAPQTARAALIYNPNTTPRAYLHSARDAAPLLGVEMTEIQFHDIAFLEASVAALAGQGDGALLIQPDVTTTNHRGLIIALAARHRLPAIYAYSYFAAEGGLMSYGIDVLDQFRRCASYVDRILRGAKPADLPVQAPSRFDLVVNLKTAKALGLDVPPTLLARADEVIE